MKVKTLIDELRKCNPEARVYFGSHMGEGANEILACFGFANNDGGNAVILGDETQFDVGEEIKSLYGYLDDNGYDETDGYELMIDLGFTPDVVEKYRGKDEADHMREYCEEHGLL